jgi:SAM-dependent methyltransferase
MIIKLINRAIEITFLKKCKKFYKNRIDYQRELIDFSFDKDDKVLDLGSGNNPFPYATHLVDLYAEDNFHRGGEKLVTDERPIYNADICALPFADKEFDFVYCSHVLEHVEDPMKACSEIMRVGKRGYIETPTRLSDMMYNFSYLHQWHVELSGTTLIFMKYSERDRRGTGTNYFVEQQLNTYDNPFKSIVFNNRDIFCNMLLWENNFDCYVFDDTGKPL